MQQQLLPAAVHKLWMCATFDTGPIQNFSFFNIWWTTCSYFSLSNFINTRTFKCAHKMNVVWHTNKRTFISTHTFFLRTGKKAKHKIIWHVKRKINLINIRRGAHCFVRVHVFEEFYVQTKEWVWGRGICEQVKKRYEKCVINDILTHTLFCPSFYVRNKH